MSRTRNQHYDRAIFRESNFFPSSDRTMVSKASTKLLLNIKGFKREWHSIQAFCIKNCTVEAEKSQNLLI